MNDSAVRFALHGGAGIAPGSGPGAIEERRALRAIAEEAVALLRRGDSAVEVVTAAVERLEQCPLFNAGIGSVLNRRGTVELDAAVMDGRDRSCGAVAGVQRIQSPVRLARAVMADGAHVLMIGEGAEAFARIAKLAEVPPDYFITPQRQLEHARAGAGAAGHGTVGAVARDARGDLAAATSTGGLLNKRPGRVGDSAVIGGGTFADNETLAISCTGSGESFIRTVFGMHVHGRMRFGGWPLERACREALDRVAHFGGDGGCIAISRGGEVVLPFNSPIMHRAWLDADDELRVAVGEN